MGTLGRELPVVLLAVVLAELIGDDGPDDGRDQDVPGHDGAEDDHDSSSFFIWSRIRSWAGVAAHRCSQPPRSAKHRRSRAPTSRRSSSTVCSKPQFGQIILWTSGPVLAFRPFGIVDALDRDEGALVSRILVRPVERPALALRRHGCALFVVEADRVFHSLDQFPAVRVPIAPAAALLDDDEAAG